MINPFQYVFGPVHSWRLGTSLGVDPISLPQKICNMDCIYCQLGKTARLTQERKVFVSTKEIVQEMSRIPKHFMDYITFAGRGEPTLALNLGDMIREVKAIRHEKVAVLTNSALMDSPEVQQDLMQADFVLAKLDAGNQTFLDAVGGGRLNFEKIVQGIKNFRAIYKGKLALQIMLVNENIDNVKQIAEVSRHIGADEVQLDTPLRPCGVKPLERHQIQWAKRFFLNMPIVSIYDAPLKQYNPMDDKATQYRHGNFRKINS